jgi:hypothetical protein
MRSGFVIAIVPRSIALDPLNCRLRFWLRGKVAAPPHRGLE